MMTRTHSRSLDQLEGEVASLKNTIITEEVTTEVNDVAQRLQQLTTSLEKMTNQFKKDLWATSERLEGGIDRGKEDQNLLVAQMKQDQAKFQGGSSFPNGD